MELSFNSHKPAETIVAKDGSQRIWLLPKQMGDGFVSCVEIRPGFSICISDYNVRVPVTIEIEYPGAAFGFGFYMSGSTKSQTRNMKKIIESRGGQSAVYYYPDPSGTVAEAENSHRKSITLLMKPSCFYDLFHEKIDILPESFKSFCSGALLSEFAQSGIITEMISHVLYQIINCPFKGRVRQFYLEAKAMELIVLRLEQMEGVPCACNELPFGEMEKINAAADLLLADLENPPSLFGLARSVGVSHGKLNQGFNRVFGTTVFGYLRECRLGRARQLLSSKQMNVTQAALNVGYTSLPSFSRAFYNRFGVTPKQYIKES